MPPPQRGQGFLLWGEKAQSPQEGLRRCLQKRRELNRLGRAGHKALCIGGRHWAKRPCVPMLFSALGPKGPNHGVEILVGFGLRDPRGWDIHVGAKVGQVQDILVLRYATCALANFKE